MSLDYTTNIIEVLVAPIIEVSGFTTQKLFTRGHTMPQFDVPVVSSAAPAADVPSLADILGSGPETTPVAEADKSIVELGAQFGIQGADAAATKAALQPVLELMARGGQNQQQQAPQQQQGPQQYENYQAPQQQQEEISFDDIELGDDVSPEIAKAFKQLGARSSKAIKAATAQAMAAQAAAANTAVQYQQQLAQANQNQQAEVSQRAIAYLDNLASPKYGVGSQRTMVQTLASEQVMSTAGNLIRGMQNYGQVLPIEQVMSAAILMVDGSLPTAPAAPVQSTSGLTPTAPKGATAAAPVRQVGSAGLGQQLMSDADYMEGARAIMSRAPR